jgi:D-alanine-D-alanine ligase-like ATP-grasp enzyme
LEINTLPGLSKASFIPQQLVANGETLRSFFLEQVTLAERRNSQ